MKLNEIAIVTDIDSSGIPIAEFLEERVHSFNSNGLSVYIRSHKTDPLYVLFDIDEKALVSGRIINTFKGKTKNIVFTMERAWSEPEVRNKGYVTAIMMGIFENLQYALQSDVYMSIPGKAMWEKLLKITHCSTMYRIEYDSFGLPKKVERQDRSEGPYELDYNNSKVCYIIEGVERISHPLLGEGFEQRGSSVLPMIHDTLEGLM